MSENGVRCWQNVVRSWRKMVSVWQTRVSGPAGKPTGRRGKEKHRPAICMVQLRHCIQCATECQPSRCICVHDGTPCDRHTHTHTHSIVACVFGRNCGDLCLQLPTWSGKASGQQTHHTGAHRAHGSELKELNGARGSHKMSQPHPSAEDLQQLHRMRRHVVFRNVRTPGTTSEQAAHVHKCCIGSVCVCAREQAHTACGVL